MILIIDNYDSFTFNLYQCVKTQIADVQVVRNDQITVAEIAALAPQGILISPGPSVPEKAGICLELVQTLAGKIPMLGVCLGHQAITVAFGGKVVRAPEIVHGKEALIFHRRTGLFQQVPLPFTAGRYHSLIAERSSLPQELIIEAETSDGIIMAIRHEHYPIFGVQFHPESILTPHGDKIVKNFLERYCL